MSSEPSQGIALLLAYFLGIFGADKFYLGLTGQGIAMLILTLTLVGLIVTVPWTYLSSLFLVISILWNSKPMLYSSSIKWAPVTRTDKIIAWIILGLTFIGILAPIVMKFFVKSDNTKSEDTSKDATKPEDEKKETDKPTDVAPETNK